MSVSIVENPVADDAEPAPSARPKGRFSDPWAVAALTAIISGAWAGRPSLWFDEGATISASASRTLPELWKLLGHIDAVHGLYYLLMHGWFAIFPPTEFWSRVPSCLAVGAAAAGVVVFAKQFSGRGTALCAGAVFAILPRVGKPIGEAEPEPAEAPPGLPGPRAAFREPLRRDRALHAVHHPGTGVRQKPSPTTCCPANDRNCSRSAG